VALPLLGLAPASSSDRKLHPTLSDASVRLDNAIETFGSRKYSESGHCSRKQITSEPQPSPSSRTVNYKWFELNQTASPAAPRHRPDLVRGLADGIGCTDRAVDQGREPADRRDPDQRATKRGDACAQQLRLAAESLKAARSAIARGLDPLQALLPALADRDQLGLDLATALDSQADGICLRATGHRSASY
jgi:hypothetical protein